jgi:hypothetical protein
MGTRCLTFVYDGDEPIMNLYRQYDGYPKGHGAELALFLSRGELIRGLTGEDRVQFNGMGCLAAQVVAHFKQSVGGFYIHPVTDTECGQDYEYHVYEREQQLMIRVVNRGCNMFGLTMDDTNEVIFEGTAAELYERYGEELVAE